MNDPVPENIAGKKIETVSHEVHHHVRWDYLVGGLLALYLAYKLLGGSNGQGDDQQDRTAAVDGEAAEVPINGGGLGA